MSVRNSLNNGLNIVRSSWTREIIYLVTFGLLMSIILLPFSFLVAIASIGIETDVTNPLDLGLFFWVSVSLLFFVSNLFLLMIIGMIQKIGEDKSRNMLSDIEELVKYPFQNGRFWSYVVLGLITSILYGTLGVISYGVDNLFDITTNEANWDNWVLSIIGIVVFLFITPPIIIASRRIIKDTSRFDAFVMSWRHYISKFVDYSILNVLSVLPLVVVIALISFMGIVISWVGDGDTALNLFYILSLSFLIILVSFFMVFIALPYYFITVGNSDDEMTPSTTSSI